MLCFTVYRVTVNRTNSLFSSDDREKIVHGQVSWLRPDILLPQMTLSNPVSHSAASLADHAAI